LSLKDVLVLEPITFAAEQHHNDPDVVVRMKEIKDAVFNPGLVRFFGDGILQDTPVFVTVSAGDG